MGGGKSSLYRWWVVGKKAGLAITCKRNTNGKPVIVGHVNLEFQTKFRLEVVLPNFGSVR